MRFLPWISVSLLFACGRAAPVPSVDAAAEADSPFVAVVRAEDRRRAGEVPPAASTAHDVIVRRRAARALARIADPASQDALLRALSDEDLETAGWGAYGLAWTCKGHEEARVRAIAARCASLDHDPGAAPAARNAIDAQMAMARAMGRCGGPLAEQVLGSWLRTRGPWAERAALALGDVVGRRGALSDEIATLLLDAAASGPSGPGLDAALYPFGRVERVSDAFTARVVAAAHDALQRPGDARAFAIRALARSGRGAATDLVRFVGSKEYTVAERSEAARALGQIGNPGREGAASALLLLTPDKDPLAITALGGDDFDLLYALIGALGGDAPKKAEPALYALAALKPPGEVPASLARRINELRCSAAGALARGAYDADILRHCDATNGSEAAESARLGAVVQRPLTGERRAAWVALTRSANVRVREKALEAASAHPELAESARVALAEALQSGAAGLVATAAEVVHAHPERVLTLAESEKHAALDPTAPPPSANPARTLDPEFARALEAAIDHPWSEDLVETRVALVDAAVAVHLPRARDAAMRACHEPNATVRDHAVKALRALGEASPACPAPDVAPTGADSGAPAFLESLPTRDATLTFTTDAGKLTIVLEPSLAPLAVERFVALARAGFYNGVVVHRVVPGFVVQFGDPGGDGYGGSGTLLRCETSPVPFARLDVGVALAGRDTGSSQLFVTLDRYPHLDGEYTRVGRAGGDWDAVAQGDVIRDVKVDE